MGPGIMPSLQVQYIQPTAPGQGVQLAQPPPGQGMSLTQAQMHAGFHPGAQQVRRSIYLVTKSVLT